MPTLKEQLKQRLRDNDPAYRYYKSIFNLVSDLIALSDGERIIDANSRFTSFFARAGEDVFAPDFVLSRHFEPIDKYGYVYEGYEGKRWFEHVLSNQKEHYRVGIVAEDKLHSFNIALAALEPVELIGENALVLCPPDVPDSRKKGSCCDTWRVTSSFCR